MKKNKQSKRVQLQIGEEILIKLDKYADLLGVSRQALAVMFIAQGLTGFEKAFDLYDKFGEEFMKKLAGKDDDLV